MTGQEKGRKWMERGKDSKIKRADECFFPCKSGIKGKACREDSHSAGQSVAGFYHKKDTLPACSSAMICLRECHRQTQSSYLSHSVTSLQRTSHDSTTQCHTPREKRNKTHHVLTFTQWTVTLELWLNKHTERGGSFRLETDKQNKKEKAWFLVLLYFILDPFSYLK